MSVTIEEIFPWAKKLGKTFNNNLKYSYYWNQKNIKAFIEINNVLIEKNN